MITVKRFTASWCQPCKVLAPTFKEFEAEYTDLKFYTIDVDKEVDLVDLYAIRNVPTVIVEKDNQIVERISGLNTKQTYIKLFDKFRETI